MSVTLLLRISGRNITEVICFLKSVVVCSTEKKKKKGGKGKAKKSEKKGNQKNDGVP